jgi:hypothetical protein
LAPLATNITPLTTSGTALPPAALRAVHAGTSLATLPVLIWFNGEYRVAA